MRMSDKTELSKLLAVVPAGYKMSVNVLQNQLKCVSTITGRVKLWLGSEEAFKTALHSPRSYITKHRSEVTSVKV